MQKTGGAIVAPLALSFAVSTRSTIHLISLWL